MTNDELAELERLEREARFEAMFHPTDSNRRRGRDVELTTYRSELGDDNDD